MRQERTVQATIFEVFAGHDIGCELKAISQWLDGQRALVSLVAGDLRRHGLRETGRRGLPDHRGLNSREPDLGFCAGLFSLVFGCLRTLAICFQLSECLVEPLVCHFSLLIIGKLGSDSLVQGCSPLCAF